MSLTSFLLSLEITFSVTETWQEASSKLDNFCAQELHRPGPGHELDNSMR